MATDDVLKQDILKRTEQPMGDLDEMGTDNLVALYLREGGRHDLLTREEEIELSRMWHAARAAYSRLDDEGDRLSPDERDELQQIIRSGETARRRMIRSNLRLVVSVAARYRGYGVPLSDLIQEGNMGLMHALDKFDPERGNKFSTYATWWIRHSVGRAIADQGRTIRLPVHMNEKIRKVKEATSSISQQTGKEPTVDEIAAKLDLSTEKVEELLQFAKHPISFEAPVGDEDSDATLGDFLPNEEGDEPYDSIIASTLNDELHHAFASLTPREVRILNLRYGLKDGHEHTLEEVGQKYGLTRERIRQIEKEALRKLRHPSRSRRLRAYL